MIINETVTGIISIIIGYLLGSIPFAYIFVRLATGKDIRKVSGGNVGARNTFRNIGKPTGIATGFFDVAKGFAAPFIAYRLLDSPSLKSFDLATFFVLASGLAVVAGHIWSLYLRFHGGNGLAAAFGALIFVMPWEILIAVGITVVLWAVTRNVVFAFNLSLFSLPISGGILSKSWVYIVYPVIVVGLMMAHFGPVIAAEVRRANSRQELFDELFRRKGKAN